MANISIETATKLVTEVKTIFASIQSVTYVSDRAAKQIVCACLEEIAEGRMLALYEIKSVLEHLKSERNPEDYYNWHSVEGGIYLQLLDIWESIEDLRHTRKKLQYQAEKALAALTTETSDETI